MTQKNRTWALLLCGVLGITPQLLHAQTYEQEYEKGMKAFLAPVPGGKKVSTVKNLTAPLMPNDAGSGITTPGGFGGSGTFVFGGIGGAYPEVYTNSKTDLTAAFGVCVGNPDQAVNFAASLNMGSLRKTTDFSANFIVSRSLGGGSSIAAGALQVFASNKASDAPQNTFYVAFSHAIQGIPSLTPGCSGLTYSIGVGTGRFYDKSPQDKLKGKGEHGTAVFGGLAYEVVRHLNVVGEWTGMNLSAGVSTRPFGALPVSVSAAVTNLTRYSGDKSNMVFSVGLPLSLTRSR